MDDSRLSARERIILGEIERALRRDRRLVKAMRPSSPSRPARRPARHAVWLPVAVALLAGVSITLIVVGVRTSRPAAIWAFAALWPVTLWLAFRLFRPWGRWARRRKLG